MAKLLFKIYMKYDANEAWCMMIIIQGTDDTH